LILLKTISFKIFSYLLSNKQCKFWHKIKNFIYKFKYFKHFEKENAILVFWLHIKIRFRIKLHRMSQFNLYVSRSIDYVYIVWCREKKVSRLGIAELRQETEIDIRLIYLQYASHSSCRILYVQLRERRKKRNTFWSFIHCPPVPYHLVFHLRSANCFFTIASRAGPVFSFRPFSVSCFLTTRYSERDNIDAYLKSANCLSRSAIWTKISHFNTETIEDPGMWVEQICFSRWNFTRNKYKVTDLHKCFTWWDCFARGFFSHNYRNLCVYI